MCSRWTLALLIGLVTSDMAAQPDSADSRAGWFITLHSGGLFQQTGDAAFVTASLMSGVRYDRLSFGVGTGYDSYERWALLPVFAGLGYDIIHKRQNSLYVEVDGGYSRAHHTLPDDMTFNMKLDGGYFVHPKVGFRSQLGRFAFHLSAGYKFQRLHYEDASRLWWWWGVNPRSFVVRDMERLSVQMGIGIR